jgi:uncharacterized RDD family membrane protein YckC
MIDLSGVPVGNAHGIAPSPLSPRRGGSTLPDLVLFEGTPRYVFVGFWRRFCAFLIDQLLLALPGSLVVIRLFSGLSANEIYAFLHPFDTFFWRGQWVRDPQVITALDQNMWRVVDAGVLILAIQILYYVVFWTSRGGTLGQRTLGIHVRTKRDLAQIGVGRACLRLCGWLISAGILFIGFSWVVIDARHQGWHDKIAGTVVVRRVG